MSDSRTDSDGRANDENVDENVIVCRCEDITLKRLRELIGQGYRTTDELRRVARCGMGQCQGRTCRGLVAQELARATGRGVAEVEPCTFRPPSRPVTIGALARSHAADHAADHPADSAAPGDAPDARMARAGPGTGPPIASPPVGAAARPAARETADAVIVGGGIIGCATAYKLARLGMRRVVVLERSYLASGATGRCGAGVRCQWGTEMNCRLAWESIRQFEGLNQELEYEDDIEFKQGGYLMLAFGERQWQQFLKNVALERGLGIPVETLAPAEARHVVPHLAAPGLVGATFCAKDGHCNPFKTVDAYAGAARRLGVEVRTHDGVTGIEVANGRVEAVHTATCRIATPLVLDAAGPYCNIVAHMAGADLPVYTERHQILVSEPVERMQEPMVISFHHGLYCQQVPNGNFVMGVGDPNEPKGFDIGHSWQFLEDIAHIVTGLLPALAGLRVIRQWSGLYCITPDRQPILGAIPAVQGLFVACGFSGHGFMIAPMVAEVTAQMMLAQKTTLDVSMLDIGRFARGELIIEPSVV
jgi:sarcosine oxidase subunit beta